MLFFVQPFPLLLGLTNGGFVFSEGEALINFESVTVTNMQSLDIIFSE